jgi:hypothetical protein
MRHLPPWANRPGVWDVTLLTSLGLDPDQAATALRRSPHQGFAGAAALPDEDLERAMLDAGLVEGVMP